MLTSVHITWSSWFKTNVGKCWMFEPKNSDVKIASTKFVQRCVRFYKVKIN